MYDWWFISFLFFSFDTKDISFDPPSNHLPVLQFPIFPMHEDWWYVTAVPTLPKQCYGYEGCMLLCTLLLFLTIPSFYSCLSFLFQFNALPPGSIITTYISNECVLLYIDWPPWLIVVCSNLILIWWREWYVHQHFCIISSATNDLQWWPATSPFHVTSAAGSKGQHWTEVIGR